MTLNDEQLATLARLVADTCEHEIDCEEMLRRAAAFVEAVRDAGRPLSRVLAEVAQHLRVCPECREEVEMMLDAMASEENS